MTLGYCTHTHRKILVIQEALNEIIKFNMSWGREVALCISELQHVINSPTHFACLSYQSV